MEVCIFQNVKQMQLLKSHTGYVRLIRSYSSARFSFEFSENLNYRLFFNSNFAKNFELENYLN